jgi:hypothetical protein
MNQFSPPVRVGGTGTGRFRGSYDGAAAGLEPGGSLSDMAVRLAKIVRAVGIGHVQMRHDPAFEPFHRLSLRVGLVIVAIEVQKPMYRQVGEVM